MGTMLPIAVLSLIHSFIAGPAHAAPAAGESAPGSSIYHLSSRWTDQEGRSVSLGHFKGRPVVLAMIYVSCHAACPLIVSDLQRIEKKLAPGSLDRIRFVLVSFDAQNDSPERLKAFGEGRNLDPKRWALLTGDKSSVRDLAAVLGIQYKQNSQADFSHSNTITILDPSGVIRHQQVGLKQDPEKTVRILNEMATGEKLR